MPKPEVLLLSLGGTIAMAPDADAGGAVPQLRAEDLLAAVPGLGDVATVRAESFRQLPGAHLTLDDLVALARRIELELGLGELAGVVVTQGTDTLEESAFALDLLAGAEQPVVVTGAMRAAHLAGADGPGNVLDAVCAASSPRLRGIGTVVVLGGEIHAARLVRKAHTQAPAAFSSPLGGAIGWVAEGRPRLALRPAARVMPELSDEPRPARVALVTASLGDDGTLLGGAVAAGFDGIVIEALGGGHLPAVMLDAVGQAVEEVPVVLASRTHAGEMLGSTYAFPGSELDLLRRGVLSAGWLDGPKARVLLSLLLGSGSSGADLEARLARYLQAAAPA